MTHLEVGLVYKMKRTMKMHRRENNNKVSKYCTQNLMQPYGKCEVALLEFRTPRQLIRAAS